MGTSMVPDLCRNVYGPAGITLTRSVEPEAESSNDGACRFGLGGHDIVFRAARTTPTKVGQFVTLWKRSTPGGPIAPFDMHDAADFVVVHTANGEHQGQFIFDRRILIEQGIFSTPTTVGKRAIRVYPPWSVPLAKQAVNTQRWQLRYFLVLAKDGTADARRTRQLLAGPPDQKAT